MLHLAATIKCFFAKSRYRHSAKAWALNNSSWLFICTPDCVIIAATHPQVRLRRYISLASVACLGVAEFLYLGEDMISKPQAVTIPRRPRLPNKPLKLGMLQIARRGHQVLDLIYWLCKTRRLVPAWRPPLDPKWLLMMPSHGLRRCCPIPWKQAR